MTTQVFTRYIYILNIVIAVSVFSACGGSSDTSSSRPGSSTSSSGSVTTPPDYSKLKPSTIEAKELIWATDESLALHLKNGLRINTGGYHAGSGGAEFNLVDRATGAQPEPTTAPETALDTAGASDNYSETNTHVEGVDESDFVKYDGSHIFLATAPNYTWGEERPNASIRILATNPEQASVTGISEIPVENTQWGAVSELYLVENSDTGTTSGLATIRSSWSAFCGTTPSIDDVASSYYPYESRDKVQLAIYDVSNPGEPEKSWTASIDGYLQDSRKIGNTMYLVTQYSPTLPGLVYYPNSEQAADRNEQIISAANVSDFLPTISINGAEPTPVVEAERCLVPVDRDEFHGFASMTTLVAVDLESQQVTSSLCLNSRAQGIYASEENLYIGGTSNDNWFDFNSFTVIHKLNLQDGNIDYRSTGIAPGSLGWSDPAFRMDEHNDYFRVISTSRDDAWQPIHRLTVFKDAEDSDLMEVVASIPNEARPQTIGKPNEDIYSVRFRGDKAYVVTFERIDPLYVLDLATPEDPFVAGELEVPGFSNYLHPINDNYLLGFGRDVVNNQQQGVKISLFDVSNSTNPLEVDTMSFGGPGSYSEALYDLRAASFLFPNSDQLRFTVPIQIYGDGYIHWENEALHLFEVNGLDNNTATLNHTGSIISEEASASKFYPDYYTNRGVQHDNTVYYIHGPDVFASFWNNPEAATGPH